MFDESDDVGMMETIYLHSVQNLAEEIIVAGTAPDSEFIDEQNVEW